MRLDPLRPAHLEAVTDLHRAAFGVSGLSALGRPAVRRYYAWVMRASPAPVQLGAFEDGRLVGFCIAGPMSGVFERFTADNRLFLAAQLLSRPWLVFHPSARKRLRLALARLRLRLAGGARAPRRPAATPARATRPPYSVLVIATDPGRRRAGIGRSLMEAVEAGARRDRVREMSLYVKASNHEAIRFYERLGWTRRVVGGVWYGEMTRGLSAPPGG